MEDHAVGARESPAQRVAVTLESMPPVHPVDPVLAQQFSGILNGGARPNAYRVQREGEQDDSPAWDRLKQRGFRMTDQMLAADAMARRNDGKQGQGGEPTVVDEEAQAADGAQAPAAGARRLPILRLGATLLADGDPAEFVHALTDSIRQGRNFGGAWRLEVLVSGVQLPQTRLYMECNETHLHLRFVCADLDTRRRLEKSAALLESSLGTVSMRPVLVEIEQDGAPASTAQEPV